MIRVTWSRQQSGALEQAGKQQRHHVYMSRHEKHGIGGILKDGTCALTCMGYVQSAGLPTRENSLGWHWN
jgi:hypothetical protein